MEAIRKPSTAAERLVALIARYPEDKFIWIMPQLDLAGELPEHLDFMVSTRKLHDTDVYDQGGRAALRHNGLMALAADAGIKWVSQMSGRQDDGSNPDIVDWQATGLIADLGGLTPITRNKHIDLERMRMRDRANKKSEADIDKNDMQRQQFKYEMAESGAANRVVRDALGIPNTYAFDDIKKKQFAILRVILSPKARTPEERKMILGRMMDNYMPAFPKPGEAAQPVLIEAAPDRPRIEGPREPTPQDIEVEIDDWPRDQTAGGKTPLPASPPSQVHEGNPPTSFNEPHPSPDGEGCSIPYPTTTPTPIEPQPAPSGSSKPPITTEKITFLQAVAPLKADLYALLGDEEGAKEYYKLLLATTGAAHANEVADVQKQGAFFRKLERMVKLTRENPPRPSAKPFAEALAMARSGYEKLAVEKLTERIEAQMELQHYPDTEDPLAIIPVLTQGNKAELVNAAVKLMERGIIQTRDERDEAKGGAKR